MAIVSLSGLITNIKGSIAGSTFQNSGAGLTMRKKPFPLKSKTNEQTQVRVLQARLNAAWLGLTSQQRLTWQAYSDFTNGYGLTSKKNKSAGTGKMQFLTVNFWCLLYGKSIITTPSFTQPLDPCIPCPPYYDYTNNLMNYDGNLDTTQEILVTRVSLPQSLATNTSNTGFRTIVYNQIDGDEQNWSSAYQSTFGVPLTFGYKYWIELQKVNFITGAISAPARKLVEYTNVSNPLIITINTTNSGSASDTFILPCQNIGTYNAIIDWGDGEISSITSYNDADLTHVYSSPGIYSIQITGDLPSIYFNLSGDRLKVVDIVQWGNWAPDTLIGAFRGCTNLVVTATDVLNTAGILNAQLVFDAATLVNFEWQNSDYSNINSLSNALRNAATFNQNMGSISIQNLSTATNVFRLSGMSSANYTDTIVGWANFVFDNGATPASVNMSGQSGMTFDTSRSGGSNFATAGDARTYLTTTLSWTISGDTVI